MMRRRDAYFAYLDTECAYRHEGRNLVMEIPDLDAEPTLQLNVTAMAPLVETDRS